jgi:hypothetical protein
MKTIKLYSSGSVLLMACIFALIFALLGVISMRIIVSQSSSDELEIIKSRLFYAADSAIEMSMNEVVRLTNIRVGGAGSNFFELPLSTAAPVSGSPWAHANVVQQVDFRYTFVGASVGGVLQRFRYYILQHPDNPDIRAVDADRWMIYDNTNLPPIKVRSIMREETYQNDFFNFPRPNPSWTDPWAWNAVDGNAMSTPTNPNSLTIFNPTMDPANLFVRRYYVITTEASLYDINTGNVYGDIYTIEAHILIERKGSVPSAYGYNYVFRSRRNL